MIRRAIFVLGMHRSGTSMVAGLLKALRVNVGADEELMAPGKDNPKGFFEHLALYQVNVDILARLGGDWWQIPAFPHNWEGSERFEDLRRRAGAAIEQSFGRSQLWGFKDPRLSLTMPFWRIMAGCPVSCILMVRNPLDVAKSLGKRNGFPIARGADLWRRYTTAAIANTSGFPRQPVLYENFLADFDKELARLADFCGLPSWRECRTAARSFAEEGMRNERSVAGEMESHPEIPSDVKTLYAGLCEHIRKFGGRRDGRAEESLNVLGQLSPVRP